MAYGRARKHTHTCTVPPSVHPSITSPTQIHPSFLPSFPLPDQAGLPAPCFLPASIVCICASPFLVKIVLQWCRSIYTTILAFMFSIIIVQGGEKHKHNLGTNMQISAGSPTRLTHVLYDLSHNHKYESLDGLA